MLGSHGIKSVFFSVYHGCPSLIFWIHISVPIYKHTHKMDTIYQAVTFRINHMELFRHTYTFKTYCWLLAIIKNPDENHQHILFSICCSFDGTLAHCSSHSLEDIYLVGERTEVYSSVSTLVPDVRSSMRASSHKELSSDRAVMWHKENLGDNSSSVSCYGSLR